MGKIEIISAILVGAIRRPHESSFPAAPGYLAGLEDLALIAPVYQSSVENTFRRWHGFIMQMIEPNHFLMDKKQPPKKEQEEPALPPDPETLGKTDPQENMKGPISSTMHKIEEAMEKNDQEVPEEEEPEEKKDD